MTKIEVQLFGAFRDFDDSGILSIEVPSKSSVLEIKNTIMKELQKIAKPGVDLEALLKFSVIANEENLLQDQDFVDLESLADGKRLAVLPPVCGG